MTSPHPDLSRSDIPPATTSGATGSRTRANVGDADRVDGRAASLALLVVLFASFMDLLDVTIVTVAAPNIAADLCASPAQVQWTLAAYTLALGSGLITGGRVGDDRGRRRVFLVSLACFAAASAACALAPCAGALIAVRSIQGLAAAPR